MSRSPTPSTPLKTDRAAPQFAGVHLSGANAHKTALAVLSGELFETPLKIVKVYEKIGSFGSLFSDERLVEILTHGGPFAEVFVDCPLTLPPCVACQRPHCPGAVQCEDVSVAYMLAISTKLRRRGARKARPVNPQSQRLWDVLRLAQDQAAGEGRLEPSFSANMAPLVARARTLQRRLNALAPRVTLRETSVGHALEAVRELLELPDDVRQTYRRFEDGLDQRAAILEAMIDAGWIEDEADPETIEQLVGSVETFHAFVGALVGAFYAEGQTEAPPADYVVGEGWVHVPDVEELLEESAAAALTGKKYFE